MGRPDDDSFEIARRLDKYGAGKGPPRPPKESKSTEKPIRRKTGRNNGVRWIWIFWLLALGAAVYWCLSTSEKTALSKSRPWQVQIPSSEPPRIIPALHGKGTVPAFTVQTLDQPEAAARVGEPQPERKQ